MDDLSWPDRFRRGWMRGDSWGTLICLTAAGYLWALNPIAKVFAVVLAGVGIRLLLAVGEDAWTAGYNRRWEQEVRGDLPPK